MHLKRQERVRNALLHEHRQHAVPEKRWS
jgi:hypothetical protein